MATFGVTSISMDGDTLQCPRCGGNYLHQDNITVFHRSEDDDLTTVIAQNGEEVQVTKFPSADTCNPSSRRHGLLLEFNCEQCHYDYGDASPEETKPFRLAISQHKGFTFMEWV